MKIRRANAYDSTKISEAEQLIFSDAWTLTSVTSAIGSEGSMCYVATEDDGTLLAYILGRTVVPEGEIYRIATMPEKRHRGIAYRLLDYAVKTERGRGLESLFLEVREKNIPAINLYTAYGFRPVGRRKGYYNNPPDDAIVMLLADERDVFAEKNKD